MNKTEFNKLFGALIKEKRETLGLSQNQLADKLGNNFQNISRIERGEIAPTLYWCYNLSKALDIELEDLLKDFPK